MLRYRPRRLLKTRFFLNRIFWSDMTYFLETLKLIDLKFQGLKQSYKHQSLFKKVINKLNCKKVSKTQKGSKIPDFFILLPTRFKTMTLKLKIFLSHHGKKRSNHTMSFCPKFSMKKVIILFCTSIHIYSLRCKNFETVKILLLSNKRSVR